MTKVTASKERDNSLHAGEIVQDFCCLLIFLKIKDN